MSGNGANTSYTIVDLRFARVMDVKLNGNPKYFRIQPVIYSGEGVGTGPNAPSTGGLIGRVVLAR